MGVWDLSEDQTIDWVTLPESLESESYAVLRDAHDWDHIVEAALVGARLIINEAKEQGEYDYAECVQSAIQDMLQMRNQAVIALQQPPPDPKTLN